MLHYEHWETDAYPGPKLLKMLDPHTMNTDTQPCKIFLSFSLSFPALAKTFSGKVLTFYI